MAGATLRDWRLTPACTGFAAKICPSQPRLTEVTTSNISTAEISTLQVLALKRAVAYILAIKIHFLRFHRRSRSVAQPLRSTPNSLFVADQKLAINNLISLFKSGIEQRWGCLFDIKNIKTAKLSR